MEWTEALVVPAGLLQGHVGTGQLDQVNPLADFFFYIGSQAAAHESPYPSDNGKGPYLCGDKALHL